MTYHLYRYLCTVENRLYNFHSDYENCGLPVQCPNGHPQSSLSTLERIDSFQSPSVQRGSRKIFKGNLCANASLSVSPVTGRKLVLARIGAYRGDNTEDAPVVFEIQAGSAIVSQTYFKNLDELKARANRVQTIGNDVYMEYVFPLPSSLDVEPIALSNRDAVQIVIYLTSDAEHADGAALTAYTSRAVLGKRDSVSAIGPDAPLWIECLSYPE